jgi:hypothetical protein
MTPSEIAELKAKLKIATEALEHVDSVTHFECEDAEWVVDAKYDYSIVSQALARIKEAG